MRARSRSNDERDNDNTQQRDRGQDPAGDNRQRSRRDEEHRAERTQGGGRPARVPKIQYRFLKELEERRLSPDERQGALQMADKIRRFPLEPGHVMASWERFTRKAIEEYKAGTGDNEARNSQHRAYAVVFSSIRETGARDSGELKERVLRTTEQNAQAKPRERAPAQARIETQTQAQAQAQKAQEAQETHSEKPRDPPAHEQRAAEQKRTARRNDEQPTAREIPTQKQQQKPQQKGQAEQPGLALDAPKAGREGAGREGRARDGGDGRSQKKERDDKPIVVDEARLDRMIEKLRAVPPELRTTIEETARDWLITGQETQKSARGELRIALEEMKKDRSPENTMFALAAATIARTPTPDRLLGELKKMPASEQKEIAAEARMRLERYPLASDDISLIRRDQVGAAVRDVLSGTPESRKEALILAKVFDDADRAGSPQHMRLQQVAADMISDPG